MRQYDSSPKPATCNNRVAGVLTPYRPVVLEGTQYSAHFRHAISKFAQCACRVGYTLGIAPLSSISCILQSTLEKFDGRYVSIYLLICAFVYFTCINILVFEYCFEITPLLLAGSKRFSNFKYVSFV